MEGFLEKLSPSKLQGYQLRYFETKNYKLYYYQDETDLEPKGIIDLHTLISIGYGKSSSDNNKFLEESMESKYIFIKKLL